MKRKKMIAHEVKKRIATSHARRLEIWRVNISDDTV